ncbi:uncharacterized protein ACBR49_012998 isoform 3-T3 [Aulostomus maculatus]
MGRYKCAYNCENTNDSDVKYFKFPLYNQRKLKKWLVSMKWKDWTPSRFSVLCSRHFEEKCIDRTGKTVQLREDAVPTVFVLPVKAQKKTVSISPRRKRQKRTDVKSSKTSSAPTTKPATTKHNEPNAQSNQTEEDELAGVEDPQKKPDKWRIITDEGLLKIQSFPHFFHGDYCVPQDIQWAPDDNAATDGKDPGSVIEVTEAWQWIGLDIRGPLPLTRSGHKYILTLTDYYSKWVEAVPMQLCLPSCVAKHVTEIINHFGFPLGILSRLPHDIVHKINKELRDQLTVAATLLVHHQQTGTADLTTQQLIDRMVNNLIEEHPADWDVYLPAKVFALCFKEHEKTKERPFSVLCCKGAEPVRSPRELDVAYPKIRESAFVVRYDPV